MPISVAHARKMTGYDVRRVQNEHFTWHFQAVDGLGEVIAEGGAQDEKQALGILIGAVYKIHCEIVRRQQQYRCSKCGVIKSLECHHRVYRSHGGTHEIENLEATCNDCHRKIHKGVIHNGPDPVREHVI